MATFNNDFTINGSLGNISVYKRRDLKNPIARTKDGGSKSKTKTAASCQPIREINTEWSGCAKASARIRYAGMAKILSME
jgi:hypothetical protein